MIIALIVVSMVMAYLFTGGVVGAVMLAHLKKTISDGYNDPEFEAVWAGVLWPLALPLCLGIWVGKTPERAAKRAAEMKRRTRELEKELGMSPSATETPKPKLTSPYEDYLHDRYEYYLHDLDPREGRR